MNFEAPNIANVSEHILQSWEKKEWLHAQKRNILGSKLSLFYFNFFKEEHGGARKPQWN